MKLIKRRSILLAVVILFLPTAVVFGQNELKLKEGAAGTLCLGCHDALAEKMKKPFVHTPLAEGECIGCHNPHTSTYEMLMSTTTKEICYTCHDSMVPEGAASVHQVVADGQCISCHDPHAADNESNLLKKGSQLCFECHQDMAAKIEANKYSHPPVKDDCLGCHKAHASENHEKLLDDSSPGLCLQCHSTDKETFKSLHMNYPVEKGDCTSCHDPHGSSTAAMLYDNVHEPMAKRNCDQCHESPDAPEPFAVKKKGMETCMACHYDMINEIKNKSQVHWPVVDHTGCINCHSPHASPEKNLMRAPMLQVCGKCHADTIARQERAITPHPPVAEGRCSECHLPHGSDNPFILREESDIEVCADCHEWQTHTTHPIGEEYVDPRNPNVTLGCRSCHRTHGTEHKHFLYFSTTNDLCVQCHIRFRR